MLTRCVSFPPWIGFRLKARRRVLMRRLRIVEADSDLHSLWKAFIAVQNRQGALTPDREAGARLLVFKSSSGQGLGNVMGGIAFALYAAIYSGRAFSIESSVFEKILSPRYVDWRSLGRSAVCKQTYYANSFGRSTPVSSLFAALEATSGTVCLESNLDARGWVYNLSRRNLTMLGFRSTTLMDLLTAIVARGLPHKRFLGNACAFHFLFASPPSLVNATLRKTSEFRSGSGDSLGVSIQLRTGDSYARFAGGRDMREVITNGRYGLGSPEAAARAMLSCVEQICAPLQRGILCEAASCRLVTCSVFFEADARQARDAAAAWGSSVGHNLKSVVRVHVPEATPLHSSVKGVQGMVETLSTALALATNPVLLRTGGGLGTLVRNLGPIPQGSGTTTILFEDLIRNFTGNKDKNWVKCDLGELGTSYVTEYGKNWRL
ncbi:unnamed protein product [Prorocentrum cordatum]|uniref:Uncharacterized protein n=1 Tax=Prorocentrum cordatum TaxID=2364126 RepID=A0ABN9U838_9DINO|nr:unnamed protein product [Polarella glacialis]